MHIRSILAGAAIALAASVGLASAAEQFSTLEGISADVMTPQEMGVVVGTSISDLTLVLPAMADPNSNAQGVAGGNSQATGVTVGGSHGIVVFGAEC